MDRSRIPGSFSDSGVDLGVPWSSGHVDGLGVLAGELEVDGELVRYRGLGPGRSTRRVGVSAIGSLKEVMASVATIFGVHVSESLRTILVDASRLTVMALPGSRLGVP